MIVAFQLFSALSNIDFCCISINVFHSIINSEGTTVEILLDISLVPKAYSLVRHRSLCFTPDQVLAYKKAFFSPSFNIIIIKHR